MNEVVSWLRKRQFLCASMPRIETTLLFEPIVRAFGSTMLYDVKLGAYSYLAGATQLVRATVGRYCSIGDHVSIGPSQHPHNWLTTSPVSYKDVFETGRKPDTHHDELRPVTIGNDVWIGAHATIMGGVTIGDGAIIGAGAVVTRDVAPYTIVGGVPARLIRSRFPEAPVEALLAFRWWQYDLVRYTGEPLPWSDPLKALEEIQVKVSKDDIKPIPLTLHRITRKGNDTFSFDIMTSPAVETGPVATPIKPAQQTGRESRKNPSV